MSRPHPDLGSNLGAEEEPKILTKPVGLPRTVKIVLEENEDIPPTGLFIGHNGRSYLICCGAEVDVPLGVLGILDDAIVSVPIRDSGNRVVGTRQRRRFNYRRVVSAGQIAAT